MEKVLLISRTSALEDRLGDLLDSPRHVARVSSWDEAHRVLTRSTPGVTLVGPEMLDSSRASELVRLSSILTKDNKKAFLLAGDNAAELKQVAQMFEIVAAVLPIPSTPAEWRNLRQRLAPHLNSGGAAPRQPSTSSGRNSQTKPVEVTIRLPRITSGKLDSITLTRILYSLHIQKATGLLALRSGKITRRFGFNNGRFAQAPDADSGEALTSAFAWPHGEFKFQVSNAISGTPVSLYPLIQQGLTIHRPQRQVMDSLMPLMATFPTPTQLWSQRKNALDWPELTRLMAACDGQQTLEKVLSSMGRDVTAAFRAAVFAGDTDLVVFRGEKTPGPLLVEYENDSGASTSRGTSKDSTPTKIERATGTGRLVLEQELSVYFNAMNSMSPHQVFGVWEGCGREVVKETFYSLVKEHHPDVYGGNVSGKVKNLAQKIFIGIRKNYADLMKLEGKQTVAAPDEYDATESPSRRRKQMTTLRFQATNGSSKPAPRQVPNRKTHQTNPIKMGRTPTDTHPDLKSRLQRNSVPAEPAPSTKRAKSSTPAPSTTSKRTASLSGAKKSRTSSLSGARSKRTSSAGGRPRRTSSSAGLGDDSSDVEWRREQMERLGRKPSRSRRPTPMSTTQNGIPAPRDPARDHFNRGYKAFKIDDFKAALTAFENAHKAEPANGLYMTFYAFSLFKVDPEQAAKCKELLRKAIDSKHRQALPDAHLFLGQLLNADGREHRAYKHFQASLQLNPGSREAERYVRLYERRHGSTAEKSETKDSKKDSFFKNLFKK